MTTTETPTPETTQPARPAPVSRAIGSGGGLLALALVVFSVAGMVWGFVRPTLEATVIEGGGLRIDAGEGAQFSSFMIFGVVTSALGLVLGIFAYYRMPTSRSFAMMLWTLLIAVLASLSFLLVSDLTARLFHSVPSDPAELVVGEAVTLLPVLNPHVATLCAPMMAAVGYWVGALSSENSDWR